MTSLAMLRQNCRLLLGDDNALAGYTFSDAQVDGWINAALFDLSLHFPRRATLEVTFPDGQRQAALPADVTGVLSVEFPAGQEPPRFLLHRPLSFPHFFDRPGFYDLLPGSSAGGDSSAARLTLSERPRPGQAARLQATLGHAPLAANTDETSLPPRYEPLVGQYVRWQAWEELALAEARTPKVVDVPVAGWQLARAAAEAENAYRRQLAAALHAETPSAITGGWRMDKWDGG